MVKQENSPSCPIALDLSSDWEDRSIYAFVDKKSEPADTTITVRREHLAGVAFELYVERQIATLAQSLPGFEILGRATFELNGEPVVELDYCWKTGTTEYRQLQLFVAESEKQSVVAVVFSTTARGFLEKLPEFREIIRTASLRKARL